MNPSKVKVLLMCEGLPEDPKDYFYTSKDSLYVTNTIEAFKQAGFNVHSIEDILEMGGYLTVAIRETRKTDVVPTETISKYVEQLEHEIKTYSNLKAILLMGDTASKALNMISKKTQGKRIIPADSTYKIRNEKYYFGNIRVFPSYLQTGKNFLIEKAKQRMVAEDIKVAFRDIE